MPSPRSKSLLVVVLVLALGGIVVATLPRGGGGVPTAGPTGLSPSASAPAAPSFRLTVALGSVHGRGPHGVAPPRDLRTAAASIRKTFTDLYTTAFVDPARWAGGRFPGLEPFFAASARTQARKDLDELTLGRTAKRLRALRPGPARLDLRFVTDAGGHPVVAFADMAFEGTGLTAGDVSVPVSQSGRFVLRRINSRWRIESYDVRAHVPPPGKVSARARAARFVPGPPSGRPMFVLVIGSDARPGQVVTATRSDSLHIVAINPRLGRGAMVGIPRDSYVPIPGHGTAKINAALSYGGPSLTVQTVERLTGVRIDAYLLTGFDGFHRLVGAIGGVDVRVPYRMDDPNSGAHFRPGPAHLGGRQALAFSRDRHDAPGGDFGRSLNQGRVLLATLKKLREALAKDPARLIPWLVSADRYIKTNLSLPQMAQLLLAASTFEPSRIRNVVVSGSGAMVNGQSIVRLGSSAYAVFRDLAHDGVLGR